MTDRDRFIELLFGDQPLEQVLMLTESEPCSKDRTWLALTDAVASMRAANRGRTIELLLGIAANADIEARVLLWIWTTLRQLGVRPDLDGSEIKGVVIQVAVRGGMDVLAGYVDGTARYVNHKGRIIVWDLPDATVPGLVRELLECCSLLSRHRSLAMLDGSAPDVPSDGARVTLLTCNGNESDRKSTRLNSSH